jgi:hypothetical protein
METQYRVVSLKSRWFRRNKGMKRKEEESNTLRLQKGGSVIVQRAVDTDRPGPAINMLRLHRCELKVLIIA